MNLAIRRNAIEGQQQGLTGDLQARFIAYLDAKPRTIETYSKALKPFFAYLKSAGISRPTREDIIAYRDKLKAVYKASTVQTYIVPVRLFFQWAQQEGLYPNVAERIKGAKISKDHKKDALTTGQIQTILQDIPTDSLQGLRDYAILALMVTCGLRTIEVARADIGDLRTAGDSAALFIQGKGQDEKNEYVKIPQPVERAIRAYLNRRGTADAGQPLFGSLSNNSMGERMTTRSISGIVKGRFTGAGYNSDRLTAHSLRHTAGTLNLINGGTLEETQQLLRHSNISTTMIYLHHLDRAKNNSEARIAAAIF